MGDPSISVLVTAYGRTRFLQDSLESVFRQELSTVELRRWYSSQTSRMHLT